MLGSAAVQRHTAEILLAMTRLHDIKPFTNGAHVGAVRDTAGYGCLVPFLMKRIPIVVKIHGIRRLGYDPCRRLPRGAAHLDQ